HDEEVEQDDAVEPVQTAFRNDHRHGGGADGIDYPENLPGQYGLAVAPGNVQGKGGTRSQQGVDDHHRQMAQRPTINGEGRNAYQAKQARTGNDRQLGIITQAVPDFVHVQIRILFSPLGYREPERGTMA